MKNKILLGVVVILSLITYVVMSNKKETHPSFFDNEEKIKIKKDDNTIEELDLEEYLIGVLAAEMPALFHEEALKAQAVASRTYAMFKIKHNTKQEYDVVTDVTNQSFITREEMQEKWHEKYKEYLEKITNAIKETKNEVMYYNDEIIESFYFAMSNGKTEDAQTVFQEELPYIKSVTSSWDNETLRNFLVETTFTKSDFCQKLNINNCSNISINDIKYTSTNRIESITINEKKFLGTEMRQKLGLRSTDFEIKIEQENVTITTKGYGHGVGMSQYGANGMAKEGYKYKEILNYYYNDITIKKIV